jgi:hypothetical protein
MKTAARSLLFVLAFASIAAIALLDTAVSAQLAPSVLFLIPISIVNRFTGRWVGIGTCVASAGSWLRTELSKLPPSYGFSFVP